MKIRRQIIWIIVLLLLTATSVRPVGVTVITHGLNGDADGWVTGMADQIPAYHSFPGANYTFYKVYFYLSGGVYYPAWSRIGGSPPSAIDSGEIIIAFDWSQLADGNSFNTFQIAPVLNFVLLSTNFISEMNGHALCELPVHLIGHSRGGSLMCQTSLLLGTNGIWIDHLTTLDPHPLNNDGFNWDWLLYSVMDAPCATYQNVLFHDNYWQNIDFVVYGEPIAGAYIRQLSNLSGGYGIPHSNVHLWYHGTVDERYPADDTEAQISTEFSTWYVSYENYGYNAGFKWSLIGGGDRTSTDTPQGFATPMIRSGLNQAWDFGAGQLQPANRTALPFNSGAWPNIIRFNIIGTNVVKTGGSLTNKYFFQFGQSATASATVQIFLDQDANPLNGDSGQAVQQIETGTGTNVIRTRTISFNVTNSPGQYYLYAKVTGSNHTRFLYAPEKLTILDGIAPVVSITNVAKTYTNAQTISIGVTATDNVGVTTVEFYDGATFKGYRTSPPYTSPYVYNWSFTAADNGAHVWTARAYDAAGNSKTSSPVTLTVSIDATPPTVVISSPANGANLTSSSVSVSGTASDPGSPASGLNLVEVRVNGGGWQTATGTASWSRSVTLTSCGNTIEARSLDKAGNYSTNALISVVYTPANTAPNAPSNLSPPNGATNQSVTPILQASAFTDPDPVCIGDTHAASQWQVLNNAGTVVVADSGTNISALTSWLVPTNKLYYGSNYVWRVRYRDSRNGWSSYSAQTTFATGGPLLIGFQQGTNVVFKWPTNALGFSLQWITNLASRNWSNATPAPVIVNGQFTVTNKITNSARFYRLKK